MRTLKIVMMYLILGLTFLTCQGVGLPSINQYQMTTSTYLNLRKIPESVVIEPPVDCFEYAESVTGFSAEILRGIAATESHFRVKAIGDDGMSFGMFQLHSRWYESRVEKWGEFDPADPFESAVVAGRIMQENLIAFNGDLRRAIAAYKQGITGVNRNGVTEWYVDAILSWRNDSEKRLFFSLFCETTGTEGLRDGYKSAGTQDTYKSNDSFAVQVSWRGSGGVPQEQWKN
jgi:hypothetical protein